MNMECYKTRLHQHQERISNMYFNFALLLRAVGKLKTHLLDYTFCSADPTQNRETKSLIVALSRSISYSGNIFDESVMFRSPDALGLKEDFKLRFRNISRIMDCVGCDKCRLWGKVQTNGYGTALKVLFEFDERNPQKDPPLRRTELVALINTLNRVSHSLSAIKHFQYVMDNPDATDDSPDAHNASGKADRDDANSRRRQVPSETISDVFWEEWNQIWKVFGFVIKSWVSLPSQM
jgi:ERO1-like protein beta